MAARPAGQIASPDAGLHRLWRSPSAFRGPHCTPGCLGDCRRPPIGAARDGGLGLALPRGQPQHGKPQRPRPRISIPGPPHLCARVALCAVRRAQSPLRRRGAALQLPQSADRRPGPALACRPAEQGCVHRPRHPGHGRVQRHLRQAPAVHRPGEHRGLPPRLPRAAGDHPRPGQVHLRRHPVRGDPLPEGGEGGGWGRLGGERGRRPMLPSPLATRMHVEAVRARCASLSIALLPPDPLPPPNPTRRPAPASA